MAAPERRFVWIEADLLERAKEALGLDNKPNTVIVRKALIDAIGDDTLPHELKLGPPFTRNAA